MRLLLKAKYILLSVLFLIVLLVGTKYGWLVQRYTFSKTLRNGIAVTDEMKNDLARCLRTCSEKDKQFSQRLLNVLSSIETSEKTFEAQLPEVRQILLDAANAYSDSKEVRGAVEVYDAALALNAKTDFVNDGDPKFTTDVYSGIERLAAKYPRNGHAYLVLGKSLYQQNSRDTRPMAAFKKCLSILPTELSCRSGYEEAARSFMEVRCDKSGFASDLKIALLPKDTLLAPMEFQADDLAEIYQDADKGDVVIARLTPSGLSKLRKGLRQDPALTLNLVHTDKILASAQASLEALSTTNTVSFTKANQETTGEALFAEVCAKPTHPEMPKGLRI